jgi:putative exosortase-associated protein (TIGR04073 family)
MTRSTQRPGNFRPSATAVLLAALLAAPLLAPSAQAEGQSAARKTLRGLAGVGAGIVEIPGNIYQESREANVGLGLTVGLAKGLGMFVSRELVGVYELLTAPFEAPAGFAPILEPEFPWQYFESGADGTAASGDYLSREVAALEGIEGVRVTREGPVLKVSGGDALLFETSSASLTADAEPRLRALARTLRQFPNSTIVVAGNTDSTGPEVYNTSLSNDRAAVVRERLIANGVPSERIATVGYANSRPVASNANPEGRQLNRRADLELQPSVAAGPPRYAGTMSSGGRMQSGWR